MEIMNFEGKAFRSRLVDDIFATRKNVQGGLIGLTFRDAQVENCWAQSVRDSALLPLVAWFLNDAVLSSVPP